MPIAKYTHDLVKVTLLAVVGLALLAYVDRRVNIPGLHSVLYAARGN